jgi:hypothetical protein
VKQLLALLEDAPMDEIDGFPESVVAQSSEQTDHYGQDNQEGIFADPEAAQQGRDKFPETFRNRGMFQVKGHALFSSGAKGLNNKTFPISLQPGNHCKNKIFHSLQQFAVYGKLCLFDA